MFIQLLNKSPSLPSTWLVPFLAWEEAAARNKLFTGQFGGRGSGCICWFHQQTFIFSIGAQANTRVEMARPLLTPPPSAEESINPLADCKCSTEGGRIKQKSYFQSHILAVYRVYPVEHVNGICYNLHSNRFLFLFYYFPPDFWWMQGSGSVPTDGVALPYLIFIRNTKHHGLLATVYAVFLC